MHYTIIILISLVLSAFFSGIEMAFLAANKLKIELEKKKGTISAILLSKITRNPSNFIVAMLIGNNIVLVIYGSIMSRILEPFLLSALPYPINSAISTLTIQTIISTIIILIIAEFIPKALFRLNPNFILSLLVFPIAIFYYSLYPIIFLITKITDFFIFKILKMKNQNNNISFGKIDLNNFIKEYSIEQTQQTHGQEIKIFRNAMELSEVKIRECMVPRTEIIAVNKDDSADILRTKFIQTGLSKIIVYDDTIDNIIGYVHVYDMLNSKVSNIKNLTRNIIIVPEAMSASKLLSKFIHQNKGIAVVVDEFGGTSGIVTLEDLIEEIFGEIDDEFDVNNLIEEQINDTEYLFSGRLEIDYINSKYNLNIPKTDDYETLAGFIYHYYEAIPKINENINIPPFLITIKKATHNKIELISLKYKPELDL